jgi:hypothetical protein
MDRSRHGSIYAWIDLRGPATCLGSGPHPHGKDHGIGHFQSREIDINSAGLTVSRESGQAANQVRGGKVTSSTMSRYYQTGH